MSDRRRSASVRSSVVQPVTEGRRPWLIIVTGQPGSGKSSLGLRLAASLRVPYLSRDDVRWGLQATAGLWGNQLRGTLDRDVARETFIQLVEEVARRGVTAVLEFIPFRGRLHEMERLRSVAECLVLLTSCRDASRRAEERERCDSLLNRDGVLSALGHGSMKDYLRNGEEQREAVRQAMATEFAVPTLQVRTDEGYEPSVDLIIEWVIGHAGG
jgi:hypothetical protein